MSSPFLFGNQTTSSTSNYLVYFKAGRMVMNGTTVSPIKRKGTIYLYQSYDNLLHFCWKDRNTDKSEQDLIVFPDDAEFKRVPQCTTGRVYVLKLKSSGIREFYWMQESNEEDDEEFCKKINKCISHPPFRVGESSSNAESGSDSSLRTLDVSLRNLNRSLADLESFRDNEFQNLLGNMDPQQLIQIVEGMHNAQIPPAWYRSARQNTGAAPVQRTRPATETEPSTESGTATGTGNTAAATPGRLRLELGDVESIFSGLTLPKADQQADKNDVKLLSSITKSEALQTLLANQDFMKGVRERLPPSDSGEASASDDRVSEQLSSTLQSAQFQQALNKFGMALQSGQLGPLLQQFGLSQACVAAADKGDLEEFVKVLEEEEKKRDNSSQEKDGMALD